MNYGWQQRIQIPHLRKQSLPPRADSKHARVRMEPVSAPHSDGELRQVLGTQPQFPELFKLYFNEPL